LPAEQEFDQRISAVMGIDMGATHTRISLLDRNKKTLDLSKIKTAEIATSDIFPNFKRLIDEKIKQHCLKLTAMVIGLPVTISKDRMKVLSTSNLQIDTQLFSELLVLLQQEFSCQVVFERDVNLQMAYDVHHNGVEDKIVLGCYLGTGFGFSIWLGEGIYTGAHGVAGELGHIPYGNEAEICVCGNPGCLETVVSGMNLRRYYEQKPQGYPLDLFFSQPENQPFIDSFLREGAKAVATTINLFDPDTVIIGGGVVDMKDFPYQYFLELIWVHCRKPLPAEQVHFIKAASSSFNGAIGAALQALKISR